MKLVTNIPKLLALLNSVKDIFLRQGLLVKLTEVTERTKKLPRDYLGYIKRKLILKKEGFYSYNEGFDTKYTTVNQTRH